MLKRIVRLLFPVMVCLLTLAGLILLYRYDNKYNTAVKPGQPNQLSADCPLFLVDGWSVYPELLLEPEEVGNGEHAGIPTFIGEYSNLSSFHKDGSPYGNATWVMSLSLDQIDSALVLWIPELFSACRVYWNGALIGESGSIEPYKEDIRDLAISLSGQAQGNLVIQTANYRHYYSGIYYPPAIGTANAIRRMTGLRTLFYGFLTFSSLAAALFSTAVWMGSRQHLSPGPEDSLARDYGLLALSFAVRASYPCLRLLQLPFAGLIYTVEDFCSLLGLFFALRIVISLSRLDKRQILSGILIPVSAGMCVVGILIPLLLPLFPAYAGIYGLLISWYKLGLSLILIGCSLYGVLRNKPFCVFLLSGSSACGICLLAGILTINRYEPVYTGFAEEYGAFVMALCFAVMMVQRSHVLAREHAQLTLHLKDEVRRQTEEISGLVSERQKLLSELLHDVKSPMASVMSYLQLIDDNQIRLDDTTRSQIHMVAKKCGDIANRMQFMQKLTSASDMEIHMEFFDLRDMLEEYCRLNRPDLEIYDLSLLISLPETPCPIWGNREQLCRALQNLVYNATGFMPPGGAISLDLTVCGGWASLTVSDTGCGIPPERLPHIFERYYTTREQEGGQGMGLYITQAIIREHRGTITVASEVGKGTSFTVRLPVQDVI